MNGRPLGGGSPLRRGGSPESKFIIALVIIAVVLAAVAFSLFAANQSQEKLLQDRQAELDSVGANLTAVREDLAAMTNNYTDLSARFDTVMENSDNVSQQYFALQNHSSYVDTQLKNFLENDLAIAYTYNVTSKVLPDNSIDKVVTVSAYNICWYEVPSMKIKCVVKVGNVTTEYNQTYTYVRSMDKIQKSWEFGNGTQILDVWAGLV